MLRAVPRGASPHLGAVHSSDALRVSPRDGCANSEIEDSLVSLKLNIPSCVRSIRRKFDLNAKLLPFSLAPDCGGSGRHAGRSCLPGVWGFRCIIGSLCSSRCLSSRSLRATTINRFPSVESGAPAASVSRPRIATRPRRVSEACVVRPVAPTVRTAVRAERERPARRPCRATNADTAKAWKGAWGGRATRIVHAIQARSAG